MDLLAQTAHGLAAAHYAVERHGQQARVKKRISPYLLVQIYRLAHAVTFQDAFVQQGVAACNLQLHEEDIDGTLELVDFSKERGDGQGGGIITASPDLNRLQQQFQRP